MIRVFILKSLALKVGQTVTFSADNTFEKYGAGTTGLRSQHENKKRGNGDQDGERRAPKVYKFFRNTTAEEWERESVWQKYLLRQ